MLGLQRGDGVRVVGERKKSGVDQRGGFEDEEEDDVLFQSLFSWTAARKGEKVELRDLNTFPRAIARLVADGGDVLETKFSVDSLRSLERVGFRKEADEL